MPSQSLLRLFQLVSPSLPVGAYSYSEGLESLVEKKIIQDASSLQKWLITELNYGSIRLETAVMVRGYHCVLKQDIKGLNDWNQWLSATRETQELRQQSWQMGQSLRRLLPDLEPNLSSIIEQIQLPCNYAIAVSLALAAWEINLSDAIIGYLWSWATNLVSAGVRLIPLGQTEGQKILLTLNSHFFEVTEDILWLKDEDLFTCSWGLALASMSHETQYTRLFRS